MSGIIEGYNYETYLRKACTSAEASLNEWESEDNE